MPDIKQLTRTPFPFEIQEASGDELDILFRIKDLSGNTVFSVDNQGQLDSEVLGAAVNPDGTLKGSARESSLADSQWGLNLDGTDDAGAAQDALDEFSADGGGAMYAPGAGITIGLADYLDPPNNVNLWGMGDGYQAGNYATRFLCLDATSGVRISTGAGDTHEDRTHGHFFIDGGNIAPNPLYIGQATDGTLEHIHVRNAAAGGSAVLFEYAQNMKIYDLQTSQNAGNGVKLDRGAGGNEFFGFEFQSSGIYNLVFGALSGVGAGAYASPTQNNFFGGRIERFKSGAEAGFLGQILSEAGGLNQFWGTIIADAAATQARTLVVITGSSLLGFFGGSITGTAAHTTPFSTDGSDCHVMFGNGIQFVSHANRGSIAANSVVEDMGIYWNTSGAWTGAGANDSVVRNRSRSVQEIVRGTTSEKAIEVRVEGEVGERARLSAVGVFFNDGSDFSPDVGIQRNAAARLDCTAGFKVTTELEVDGALNHDGSTVGFYTVTPVARPAAYTQTYATATRTHAALTSATLTDNSGGTANTTIEAMANPADAPATADALRDDLVANLLPALRNNIADLTAQVNALRADVENVKQVANQVIDDHQANGLLQ